MIGRVHPLTRRTAAALLKRAREIDAVSPVRMSIVLFAAALLILVGSGLVQHYRQSYGMFEADEAEYVALSSSIMNGTWEISPRRTIGFPLVLAAVRQIVGDIWMTQILISSIFALSVPAIFLLVHGIVKSNVPSALAAMLFAAWPTAIFYGTSLYSETVALPIFIAALAVLPYVGDADGGRPRRYGRTVCAGIILGFAAHVRPMYLLFVPVLWLILLVEEGRLRVATLRFIAALTGFCLVVLPWSLYMSDRANRLVILTSNAGETLSGGLTPRLLEPSGQYSIQSGGRVAWVGPGKWLPIYQNGYLSKSEQALPYSETDVLLQRRAVAWAIDHPFDAMVLELNKLTYMWGVYPLANNSTSQVIFGNIPVVMLVFTSLYILIRHRSYRRRYFRLYVLALYVSGVALISWGSWRFRQAGDVGLLSLVACALAAAVRRWALSAAGAGDDEEVPV